MTSHILDSTLSLVIPTNIIKEMSKRDITNLMQSYKLMESAKDAFLAQEITFDEYLQLCETHEFNVDSYLETVESNLEYFKVL